MLHVGMAPDCCPPYGHGTRLLFYMGMAPDCCPPHGHGTRLLSSTRAWHQIVVLHMGMAPDCYSISKHGIRCCSSCEWHQIIIISRKILRFWVFFIMLPWHKNVVNNLLNCTRFYSALGEYDTRFYSVLGEYDPRMYSALGYNHGTIRLNSQGFSHSYFSVILFFLPSPFIVALQNFSRFVL